MVKLKELKYTRGALTNAQMGAWSLELQVIMPTLAYSFTVTISNSQIPTRTVSGVAALLDLSARESIFN